MVKTIRVVKAKESTDDYSWALALTDTERVNLAMKLTRDLWCAATGKAFPTLDRSVLVRISR